MSPEPQAEGPSKWELSDWEIAVIAFLILVASYVVPNLNPDSVSIMGVKIPQGHWTVEVTPISPDQAKVGQEVAFNTKLVYVGRGTPPAPPKTVMIRRNDSLEPIRVAFDGQSKTQTFSLRPLMTHPLELTGWDHPFASSHLVKLHPKVDVAAAKPLAETQLVVQPRWAMARMEGNRWRLPIGVGLVDREIYQREKRIQFVQSPEAVVVHLDSLGGTLSKDEISIPKGAYGPESEVDFLTSVTRGNSVRISWTRPAITHEAQSTPIVCATLQFDASLDPQVVPADGFTPAKLFIRLIHQEDGSLAPLAGGQAQVLLTHSLGASVTAKPDSLRFMQGEMGKFIELASSESGENLVTLFTQPFATRVPSLKVTYQFPWASILLALVGSLIGSTADVLYRRFTRRSRPSWKSILLRALLGAIAALMVWFGIRQGLSSVSLLGISLASPCSAQGSMFLGIFAGFTTFSLLGRFKMLAGVSIS